MLTPWDHRPGSQVQNKVRIIGLGLGLYSGDPADPSL